MKREPPFCTSMYSQGQVDSQVDSLQTKLEKGADVVHGEAAPVWKRWVIHQQVTGNLDGSEGWHMSKKKH